jgi:hypothetical protein
MKINLEKGKVKCHERKNIGTLGRVEHELSDNENAVASAALGFFFGCCTAKIPWNVLWVRTGLGVLGYFGG